MDTDPFDLVGDVLDGQFRVDAFAGEGDLSVVYKGHHLGVDAPVAIKCLNLPATLDAAHGRPLVEGFKDASRIHYRLARGNLNIAQSIASGTTVAPRTGSVVPYLVREWFEGESLAAELARRRDKKMTGRSVSEAMALLEAAFDGVAYAHAQGEVHLSLNPSNLFLATRAEGGATLKVLDFGVASAMNAPSPKIPDAPVPSVSRRGLRVLFPAYAAPEQLDQAVGMQGPWTDVYALALITLEVLSDRLVMSEQDNGALIEHALDERRRPNPQAHGLKLPRNLELVLTRAVLRAPDRRPKNAGELWRDLKSATRPTMSRPNQAVVGALGESGGAAAMTLVPTASAVPPATAGAAVAAAAVSVPVPIPAAAGAPAAAAAPARAPEPAAREPAPGAAPAPAPVPSPTFSGEPITTSRARAPTLVGMGIAPPAVVVGAVGSRLKVPSTPTVETQPMSFEPPSRPGVSFGVEPKTVPRTATLPAPSPPLASIGEVASGSAPDIPLASAVPSPVPAEVSEPDEPVLATQLPPVVEGGRAEARAAGASPSPEVVPAAAPVSPSPSAPATRPRLGLLAIAALAVLAGTAGFVLVRKHHTRAAAAAVAPVVQPAVASAAPPDERPPRDSPSASGAPSASAATAAPSDSAAPSASGAQVDVPAPTGPFSGAAAKRALDAVSRDVAKCRRGRLWGVGSATVAFASDGTVSRVALGAPFRGTAVGECVTETLGGVHIAPFAGKAGAVTYRFFVPIK